MDIEADEIIVRNFEFDELRPNDPSEPRVLGFDMGKAAPRFKEDLHEVEKEELLIEPFLAKKPPKAVLDLGKGEERFKEKGLTNTEARSNGTYSESGSILRREANNGDSDRLREDAQAD